MKNLRSYCAIAFSLLLLACNSIDEELAISIKSRLTDAEMAEQVDLESLAAQHDIEMAQLQVNQDLLADSTKAKLSGMMESLNSNMGQISAAVSLQQAFREKLKALIDNYNAGKLNTAAVKTEFESIKTGMDENDQLLKNARKTFDDLSVEVAKLGAELRSEAESVQ